MAPSVIPLPVWVSSNFHPGAARSNVNGENNATETAGSSDGADEEVWERKKLDEAQLKEVVGEFLLEES